MITSTTCHSEFLNFETVEPWVALGMSEEERKKAIIERLIDSVHRRRLLNPRLRKAEERAKHFGMEEVITIIQDIREETLTSRKSVYNEMVSRQNDVNFSYSDAHRLRKMFWRAVNLNGNGAFMGVIDAINIRISQPQIQDTTLRTITMKGNIKDSEDKGQDEDACCVCLEIFLQNERLQKCPGCKKCIHKHCILKCLQDKHTCPLCRHNLIHNTAAFERMTYDMYH